MPRRRRTVPCPWCGSEEVRSVRRKEVRGEWPEIMLLRVYKCAGCGRTYETGEVSLEGPELTLPSWSGRG